MRRASILGLLALVLVALSATAAFAAVARPDFSTDRTFDAGPGPVGIVDGNFDGDRNVDLVTANRFGDASTGDVSCLAGNGDGTFDAPEQQDLTTSAYAIERADFDGDGNLDVVLTDPDSGPASVAVLLGNGDCTFAEEDTEASGGTGGFEPFDLAVADFDRDGSPDVAVTNQESSNVRIFLNDGTGDLTATDTVQTGAGSGPTGIDAGNFDGDRDADLAVALSGTGEVTILENQSGGTNFDQGSTFDMSREDTVPVALEVGQFNGGGLDVATGNADGDADNDFVGVALGRGNGNFNAPRFYSSGGDSPFSLALGNFNLQRGTDIAAANQFANAPSDADRGNVGVLSNRGDGTFVGPDTFDTGDGPNDVTAGRFNGDTRPDLATANFGDDDPNTVDSVSVLRNTTR
jgi:hypothetical protein